MNGRPVQFPVVTAEAGGAAKSFEGPRKRCGYRFPEPGTSVRIYVDPDMGAYAVMDSMGEPL